MFNIVSVILTNKQKKNNQNLALKIIYFSILGIFLAYLQNEGNQKKIQIYKKSYFSVKTLLSGFRS